MKIFNIIETEEEQKSYTLEIKREGEVSEIINTDEEVEEVIEEESEEYDWTKNAFKILERKSGGSQIDREEELRDFGNILKTIQERIEKKERYLVEVGVIY